METLGTLNHPRLKSLKNFPDLNSRAKREFDVKKAEYDTDVNTAKAEADLAFDLQVTFASCLYSGAPY